MSHALGTAHSPTPVHTLSTLSHLTAKQFWEVSMVPFIQMWAWLFRRDWVTANERIPIYSPKYLSACSKDPGSLHLSILTSMISASVSGFSQCPQSSRLSSCECNTTARISDFPFSHHMRKTKRLL